MSWSYVRLPTSQVGYQPNYVYAPRHSATGVRPREEPATWRLSLVAAAIFAGRFMTPAGASERATPVPTQASLDGVRLQPDQAPPDA